MASMNKCWIVGPIAWDWPYRVPRVPASGESIQGHRLPGRLGGTGANVARALASKAKAVGMIGYIGRDEWGKRSRDDLVARGVDVNYISTVDAETSQVLLLIEPSGERTIVAIVSDELARVPIPHDLFAPDDVVYFASWRKPFAATVRRLAERRVVVVSVPFAPEPSPVPVRYVVGSMSELPAAAAHDPYSSYRSWTGEAVEALILTRGQQGVRVMSASGLVDHGAVKVDAIDSTGAGDAFAAAVLATLMEKRPLDEGVINGLTWGAVTAATSGSIPPPWDSVGGRKCSR
jgi:sugar/nucleoside kinase (ribokinase family)